MRRDLSFLKMWLLKWRRWHLKLKATRQQQFRISPSHLRQLTKVPPVLRNRLLQPADRVCSPAASSRVSISKGVSSAPSCVAPLLASRPGLGGAPKAESASRNVFGSPFGASPAAAAASSAALFGSPGAKPPAFAFGAPAASPPPAAAALFSTTGSVAQQGFGTLAPKQPGSAGANAAFGAAPTFGTYLD